MSYASFTKSFPDLIKSVPEKLTQPTSIAVMASVGIHALLGVTLPYWSVSSEEKPQLPRTVQLVELTPAEQSRLPQLSPPPLMLQPSSQLPPLSSLYPPLPKGSSLYNLPPISPLPPANQFSIKLPRSQAATRSRSQAATSSRPIQFQRSRNLKIFNGSTRIQPPPRGTLSPSVPELSELLTLKPATPPPPPPTSNQATDQPASPNQATDQPASPNLPTVAPGAQERPQTEVDTSSPPASQPSSPTTEQLQAYNPTPKPSDSSTPPTASPRQQQLIAQRMAELRQDRESLRADNTNTSNEEALRNDVAWRAQVQQAEPKALSLAGTYPKVACLKELKGTAIYNVVVDANGKPSNLVLIRSARYPIFNQQAEKQINSHSFEKTGEPRFYQVSVNFEYNKTLCPTLNTPQNLPKPQNSPESRNSPAPQNSPESRNSPAPQNSPESRNSPAPQNSPESRNSPAPQNSPESRNSPAPQNSPESRNSPAPQNSPNG